MLETNLKWKFGRFEAKLRVASGRVEIFDGKGLHRV